MTNQNIKGNTLQFNSVYCEQNVWLHTRYIVNPSTNDNMKLTIQTLSPVKPNLTRIPCHYVIMVTYDSNVRCNNAQTHFSTCWL